MDLLQHWILCERSFDVTWDTRFFYQSRDHEEALNRLTFLVDEQTMNIGMLTGEIGCGKPLTRAVFAKRLNPAKYEVVVQENSTFGFKDLLGWVLRVLDPGGSGETKFARTERFRKVIERLHSEGKH